MDKKAWGLSGQQVYSKLICKLEERTMRRGDLMACGALVFAVSGASVSAEEVIGSYTESGTFGAGLTAEAIYITIAYRTNPLPLVNVIGDTRRLDGSTSTQVIEYRSNADDPDYEDFVARLLDDIDDDLGIHTWFWGTVIGAGESGLQSSMLGIPADPDIYTITGLRLTVEHFEVFQTVIQTGPLSRMQAPGGGDFSFTWEILGTVPEPASAALVAAGICAMFRRWRHA